MATDTDIRDIKTAIEANTKAIATQSDRIESIIRGTEANTKAIADLTLEIRVGFANVDTKFAKLEGKIDIAEAKLEGKIDKLDERTKLGFWGFILRGTVLALILIVVRYLLPMLPRELPKL